MNNVTPVEISFSRINSFQKCPWLYHLIYDLNWKSGPTGPMAFGTTLHKTLDRFLNVTPSKRTWDELLEIYNEVWINQGFSGTEETLDVYDKGKGILENFFEQLLKWESQIWATEKEFEIDWEGIQFKGLIDRIDKNPQGGFEIIEYKTSSQSWDPDRIQNDLQMTLYALAAEKALGLNPVRLKYYFLSNGKIQETSRSDKQKRQALEMIKEIAQKIREKKFEPNFAFCRKCEMGPRCENFQKG